MSIFLNISRFPIKTMLSRSQSLGQMRQTSVANTKKFKKLKEMQARMQCADGIPVYLKNGTPDKVLFYLNCLLMILGGFGVVRFVWRAAKK